MMEATGYSFTTKLPTPNQLPEQGLTAVQFKPWKNQMLTFLQQNPRNICFFPAPPRPAVENKTKEGIYQSWLPSAQHGIYGRIGELHAKDKATGSTTRAQEVGSARGAWAAEGGWKGDAASVQAKAKILEDLDQQTLIDRNRDLGLLLAHITSCCYYTESDDITERSTSLGWIWTYLERHYNIAPKGANFLRIASITFTSGDNHYSFYKKFRAAFIDNLRRKDDKDDSRWSDARLAADERLSPSMEDTIVLWCLEKIDARLPEKVRKDYEHYLTADCYLSDLHPRIFQRIPMLLEELDQTANIASLTFQASCMALQGAPLQTGWGDGINLQAFNFRGGRGGRGGAGRSFRGRGRGVAPFSGSGRGGGGAARGASSGSARGDGDRKWHAIYCWKCKNQGKPESVFAAHNTVDCPSLASLTVEERQDCALKCEQHQAFLNSITVQQGADADNYDHSGNDFDQQEPDMFHQPQGQDS